MASTKEILLGRIRGGQRLSGADRVRLTLTLCGPAILAQLASVLLQFIDASMVGSLGAGPSASIGLVSTTGWIFGGFCMAAAQGFSVQVAHKAGADDFTGARRILRQGLLCAGALAVVFAIIAVAISGPLPRWLGGDPSIRQGASEYFRIQAAFYPMMMLGFFGATMLQCSGEMKIPAILDVVMCALDVVFNFLLIFPTREISLAGLNFTMWGAGMGIKGAALGTGIAEVITAALMMYFLLVRDKNLGIKGEMGSFLPDRSTLSKAWSITGPMWVQNLVMRGAYVASTLIVAPLGPVAIAANSFAIIAESFCYMPGYGMADAATTLVGQSLGASRKDLARSFKNITLGMGVGMMVSLAVVMYLLAGKIMGLLSVDPDVVALGARCLRLEAFAEAGYAASIVAFGACMGSGDTRVPTALNFTSVWLVRIGLALILTPRYGLMGYWIAMFIELNVRGALLTLRTRGDKWMKTRLTASEIEKETLAL